MDSQLEWQVNDLEQRFRQIEPRTGLHPEARELCAEALAFRLPQLRQYLLAGSSDQATVALLNTWHTYHVVSSRIAETEKVRRLVDQELERAAAAYLAAYGSKTPRS